MTVKLRGYVKIKVVGLDPRSKMYVPISANLQDGI